MRWGITMIEKLVKIADRLDQKGREDLADEVDALIKELSQPEEKEETEEPTEDDINSFWEEEGK